MTEMKKGKLFVMSGPSGTGKGTICGQLVEKEDIYLSVSHTSREKRNNETEGVTYYYVSRDEFECLVENGEMLEYAIYDNNYYGTSRRSVEKALDAGKNVLLEIEPQGALKVKELFPDAVLIFIIPPSMAELKRRLKERGRESDDIIEQRLEAAKWEFTQSPKYNYIIVNDDLDTCVEEVRSVFHKKLADFDRIDALINEKY